MDRFRVPARSLFLASLGASMLAGLGVEALRARSATMLDGDGWPVGRWLASAVDRAGGRWPRRPGRPSRRSTSSRSPGRVPEVDRIGSWASPALDRPGFWLALAGLTLGAGLGRDAAGPIGGSPRLLGLLGLVELGLHGHDLIRTTPRRAVPRGRPDQRGPPGAPTGGPRTAADPGRRFALRRPPRRSARVHQDERQRLVPDPARRRPLRAALPPVRRPNATTEGPRWTGPSRPTAGRSARPSSTGWPSRSWSPTGRARLDLATGRLGIGGRLAVRGLPEPDRTAEGLRRPPGRGRPRRRLDRRAVPGGRPPRRPS